MKKIEIERKFLVKFSSWEDVFELLDKLTSIKKIEQAYLKPIKGDPAVRVRKTVEGFKSKKTYYEINKKKQIGTAANKEVEEKISEEEYKKLLSHKDPSKRLLKKTRMVFVYQDQEFELDLFKEPLNGLLILELELKDENQKIKLPPFLHVVKEVTDQEEFNNFNLSSNKVKGFKAGKLLRHAH